MDAGGLAPRTLMVQEMANVLLSHRGINPSSTVGKIGSLITLNDIPIYPRDSPDVTITNVLNVNIQKSLVNGLHLFKKRFFNTALTTMTFITSMRLVLQWD